MKNISQVSDIDWTRWKPTEEATLLFVIRDGKILLIHKKLGLGAGKMNGPGGRLDPGETAREAAIREVQEELLVTPINVPANAVGQLDFQFVDGYALRGHVFQADDCDGVPQETDEAIPEWVALDAIPYEKMWADDRLWIPLMLAGHNFLGRFIFDDDTMLDHDIRTIRKS